MIGLGVYDCLAREIIDSETGEIYPALSCYNDKVMADRCSAPGAEKVIWSVKANSQFNSDCAFMLREAFRSGRVRLLETQYESEELLSEIKGYASMSPSEKMQFQLPYIHTDLLVDELTKLQHEESGGKVKIYEKAGMRKDRYSSLSYNYYVATQIEAKLAKRSSMSVSPDMFVIKPPSQKRKAVNKTYGQNSKPW